MPVIYHQLPTMVHARASQLTEEDDQTHRPERSNQQAVRISGRKHSHSALKATKTPRGKNRKVLDMLRRIPPIAWQHIRFRGHYTFRDNHHPIKMEAILTSTNLLSCRNKRFQKTRIWAWKLFLHLISDTVLY